MSKMSTKAILPFHSVDSFYRRETTQRASDSPMSWPCSSEDPILTCQPWNFTKNSFRRGGLCRKMTYFFIMAQTLLGSIKNVLKRIMRPKNMRKTPQRLSLYVDP